MAIQDSFSISEARMNQAYAYKCWYNYNYENNTMGIPSSAMGEIVTQYSGVLENWKAVATNDENKYEITDDDFSGAVNRGYSNAAEEAGYEGGGKTGMIGRGVVDGALAVGGALGGTVLKGVATKAGSAIVHGVAKSTTNFDKAVGTKSGAWIITAPLALATGTLYQTKKPNKEQYEAAMELMNTILPEAQAQTMEAQEEMAEADEAVTELSEEAEAANEDANDEIEENKSEFDLYRESYDTLMKKLESGEQLSEEEKELLKQLVPLMQQLGEDLSSLSDETIEAVQDLYADIEDYQDYFDNAAEMIAEVQGVTDYAESFDSTAQTMMYVEAAAQGLNAASGTNAGIQAFKAASAPFMWWAYAFSAMGFAGAAMSGLGALEQMKWAGQTGSEIDLREATQDLNSASNDVYDERIEDFEGYMETVEDLELEIPDDMEVPEEEPTVPEGGEDGAPTAAPKSEAGEATVTTPKPEDDKEKKEK